MGEDHAKNFKDKEKDLKRSKKEYYNALIKFQSNCDHPEVLEGGHMPGDYGHSLPPFRVCKDCGYSEEGWGCGYSILYKGESIPKNEVTPVERDFAHQFIRGKLIKNIEHFDAKQGRKTLQDLLIETYFEPTL